MFATSTADCAEWLSQVLFSDRFAGPGAHLVDRKANDVSNVGAEHDKAKEFVWKHTIETLEQISAAGKK